MPTVILSVDNSKYSDYAVQYYLNIIHKEGNVVKVAHCPEYWLDVGIMEGPSPGHLKDLQCQTKQATEDLRGKVMAKLAAQVPHEFVELQGKEPWQEICKLAEREKADLIVMGTRGQGTFKRTVLGSCSTSVVHHAHCPVLVCRLDQ